MPLNMLAESGLPMVLNSGAGTCNTIGTIIPVEVTIVQNRKVA